MAKKLVDVEDLLVWTAAELSRKRPGKTPPRGAFNLPRGDRELVGRWERPPSFPTLSPMFAPGLGGGGAPGEPPHADALAVEAALERLASTPLPCPMPDGELLAGLGFPVDLAGAWRAALANVANLVLVHGRLQSRPSVQLKPPEPSPKLAPNGKPGVWRKEEWVEQTFADHVQSSRVAEVAVAALRKGVYPPGAYGVVEWDPDAQDIVNERAEYAAWRAGLEWLAAELVGELETRSVLPPRAAARPWLGEPDGEPIRDLYGPGAERVYSHEDAATIAAERATARRRPILGPTVYGRAPAKPARGTRKA